MHADYVVMLRIKWLYVLPTIMKIRAALLKSLAEMRGRLIWPTLYIALDGSRRKAIDGYASICAHSPLLHVTRGGKVIPGEFCSGREGVCDASGIGKKAKFLGRGYLTGEEDSGSRVVWEPLSLYMHIKQDL